ncbi:MAG: DUF4383 domain-containing protein [Chlamydiia bacterium]|nr:DUF4383 domain-containing protein [Chlamydiia bacterium]
MRGIAIIIGIVLIALGILGMFPEMVWNHLLFSTLEVNWAVNTIYLITGICGILTGFITTLGTRLFFEVTGILYGLWAILGFVYGQDPIFGFIANNLATSWLNMIIAVITLILGFGSAQKKEEK